jgi:F-type H+-transporting ATPase subunit b
VPGRRPEKIPGTRFSEVCMQIDWFALAAQVVNFLVLVFLLQHFLFSRVTGAMDERERRIAGRLDQAEEKRRQASEQEQQLQERRRELDESRGRMLARAREEAEEQRRALVKRARSQVEEQHRRWQRAVRRQRRAFLGALRDTAARELVSATRGVLEDLASSDLEERVVDTFVRYVQRMDAGERERLGTFIGSAEGPLLVRSSFELPSRARSRVIEALEQASGLKLDGNVRFERFPALLLGIELRSDGKSVGWNVDRYLDTLSERMEDLLGAAGGDTTGTDPAPGETRDRENQDQEGSARDGA